MKAITQFSITFINKLVYFFKTKNIYFFRKKILISLSGGQDSICLFFMFLQLTKQLNFLMSTAYCAHLWNVDDLFKLTLPLKLCFITRKSSIFTVALERNFTEKRARYWRYFILYRASIFYDYKVILTGHTKTDRAETLLINLFRGSGKDGLSSLCLSQNMLNKKVKNIFINKETLNV